MEFISEKDEEYVLISSQLNVEEIANRVAKQEQFAYQFKFSQRELFIALLELLGINYERVTLKYFHYDASKKLHISESEFGYVWISTVGLIAKNKSTKNPAVNSCLNQHTVISLLLEKAIEVVKDEKVYDVDSYKAGLLSKLSPAIYYNVVFYIEVFCKAYLSLAGVKASHSHKLQSIYQKTVEVMVSKKHNNSFFQILVLEPLYKFVDHVSKIPGKFKEQFIKYDDNPQDDTVIIFDLIGLQEMKSLLEQSVDFITEYYYMGTETHFLKSNLYQRLLDKAETEEKKNRIKDLYSHLVNIKS